MTGKSLRTEDSYTVTSDTVPTMSEFSIQTEIEVLELLVDESPCHVMEITNAVDGHPITIDQACAHLHSEDCIVPRGRGLYEITDAGEQRLKTQYES